MISKTTPSPQMAFLFKNWEDTMIYSCLQGIMGELYTDSLKIPESAMILLGDFCFLSGKPSTALVSSAFELSGKDFLILVPRTPDWHGLITEYYGLNAKKCTRYAIKKEPDIFDRAHLEHIIATLPGGYELHRIDQQLFAICRKSEWCRDFVAQYPDYHTFEQYGLGIVALKNGELVSGASSYSSYLNGIEIEVDTLKDYRRKGLAAACAAKLILECLERGWYPSWDAQNPWSVALAEKLGYHFDHEYIVYEIVKNKKNMEGDPQ
jgi:GNAT superfamily N-acetyltransferase